MIPKILPKLWQIDLKIKTIKIHQHSPIYFTDLLHRNDDGPGAVSYIIVYKFAYTNTAKMMSKLSKIQKKITNISPYIL